MNTLKNLKSNILTKRTTSKTNYSGYKLFYGMNNTSRFKINSKLEVFDSFNLNDNNVKFFLFSLESRKFMAFKNYYEHTKLTVVLLDLINSYRGYRHFRGFPVRGQRTWSNGWSSFRSNKILRTIRLQWANKFYNLNNVKNTKMGLLAEYVNLLWFKQWTKIWLKAQKKQQKKKLIDSKKKKLNIKNLSEFHISIPIKTNKSRQLTKKQKSLMSDSFYLLGFKLGFSKNALLKKNV